MGFYNVINAASMQAGQPEDISQILANFNAIAAVINGGIDGSNITDGSVTNAELASGILRSKLDTATVPFILNRVVYAVPGYASPFFASSNARALFVECKGGGGGGGGNAATGAGSLGAGGGGGEGARAFKWLTANLGSHVISIAPGGAGNSGGGGSVGADTTFADSTTAVVVRAKGGAGGNAGTPGWPALGGTGGSGGGIGGAGDIQIAGCFGHAGMTFGPAAGQFYGAPGGGAGGGPPATNSQDGFAAIANSGGGGGGSANGVSSPARAGGAGGNGYIMVWEFV